MQHVKNAIGGNAMKMLKMHQNALKCTRMRMGKINTTFGEKQHLSLRKAEAMKTSGGDTIRRRRSGRCVTNLSVDLYSSNDGCHRNRERVSGENRLVATHERLAPPPENRLGNFLPRCRTIRSHHTCKLLSCTAQAPSRSHRLESLARGRSTWRRRRPFPTAGA